jgi:hypothetical protein
MSGDRAVVWMSEVQFLAKTSFFFLCLSVGTGSGAHPVSCPADA